MEPNIILSKCCNAPIEFKGLGRNNNRTYGIYECIRCNMVITRA